MKKKRNKILSPRFPFFPFSFRITKSYRYTNFSSFREKPLPALFRQKGCQAPLFESRRIMHVMQTKKRRKKAFCSHYSDHYTPFSVADFYLFPILFFMEFLCHFNTKDLKVVFALWQKTPF